MQRLRSSVAWIAENRSVRRGSACDGHKEAEGSNEGTIMTPIFKASCIVWFLSFCLVLPAAGQQALSGPAAPSAAATPAVPSTGTPSGFQIKQHFLIQKIAAVESQIQVAQRCIANASRPEVLRDPEGNVNLVPSQDITNCGRTLLALERQLVSLTSQANRLAQDAQVQTAIAQSRLRFQQAQQSFQQRLLLIKKRAASRSKF